MRDRLEDCPNCGVKTAIPISIEDKPDDLVRCSACGAEYILRRLMDQLLKPPKKRLQ